MFIQLYLNISIQRLLTTTTNKHTCNRIYCTMTTKNYNIQLHTITYNYIPENNRKYSEKIETVQVHLNKQRIIYKYILPKRDFNSANQKDDMIDFEGPVLWGAALWGPCCGARVVGPVLWGPCCGGLYHLYIG